jgi:hypothetical protein
LSNGDRGRRITGEVRGFEDVKDPFSDDIDASVEHLDVGQPFFILGTTTCTLQ